MFVLLMIKKIKELPEVWLICLTFLLFPLSVGTAFKLYNSTNISYRRGDVEIKLGQAEEQLQETQGLLKQQNRRIREINQRVDRAQKITKQRDIDLPELYYVEQAAEDAQKVNEELNRKTEELEEIVESSYE